MTAAPVMLALVTDAFGGRGGIAQYNRDFLGALARLRATSHIMIVPRHAPDSASPPAGIRQLPHRSGRLAYIFASLLTATIRPVDIVFCGHLFMAPLAYLIARLRRAKLIIQMHGTDAWPRPAPVQRLAAERADLVLCVSRYTRAAVLSWADIAPERVVVLPNTVSEAFTPGDGSLMRAELALEGKRVLLTVGRMDSRERAKGHDRVIAALPHVVAAGHDAVYLVVGEGDDIPYLKSLADRAGVADRVRFTGGFDLQRLVAAYRMADLFVMPSTCEGFGIVYLEAMASGTSALGLAVGGAPDALADGELGTIVSEDELASAIARLLSTQRRDPHALAAEVRARFGRDLFASQAGAALRCLRESALAR